MAADGGPDRRRPWREGAALASHADPRAARLSRAPVTGHPSLYEINTRVWLHELGERLGRPATLADVPDDTLDRLAADGFDWVWLLGVWQTGPVGRRISQSEPALLLAYQALLPDFTLDDVCGSPFAICAYEVHTDFGGPDALARLRPRLAQRGLRLMLDFVPNHTALDHPWARAHPEFYIGGDEPDLAREPRNYCRVETAAGPRVLAHGRDPYFPGWTDTLQVNYRQRGLRDAMAAALDAVADQCDGVRCDMAMLVLPEVIRQTWGERSRPSDGSAPVDDPFWPEAIARVRGRRASFVFLAEAYWDLEWTLQQQGFDYTYDKRLYDRLHAQDAPAVRGHLHADLEYQGRSARFLENHDEERAAVAFPPPVGEAAAVLAFLVPGLRFLHEGQRAGRRRRTAIQLRRRPREPVDHQLEAFYDRLLACVRRPEARGGEWRRLPVVPAWDGNPSWARFVAFAWVDGERRLLVAVNYGGTRAQCFVRPEMPELGGRPWGLRDLVNPGIRYQRDGDDLGQRGLYLDLPAWGHHVFELTPALDSPR